VRTWHSAVKDDKCSAFHPFGVDKLSSEQLYQMCAGPWSHHLVNAHEVKPVRLIQSLCAVCGSNLAGLTLLYIVLPSVAAVVPPSMVDVSIVNCAVCQQFNKRTLLLLCRKKTQRSRTSGRKQAIEQPPDWGSIGKHCTCVWQFSRVNPRYSRPAITKANH